LRKSGTRCILDPISGLGVLRLGVRLVIISEHNPPLIVSVSHDRVWADAPLSHPHDRVCLLAPLTVEAASHSHTIGYEVYGI